MDIGDDLWQGSKLYAVLTVWFLPVLIGGMGLIDLEITLNRPISISGSVAWIPNIEDNSGWLWLWAGFVQLYTLILLLAMPAMVIALAQRRAMSDVFRAKAMLHWVWRHRGIVMKMLPFTTFAFLMGGGGTLLTHWFAGIAESFLPFPLGYHADDVPPELALWPNFPFTWIHS